MGPSIFRENYKLFVNHYLATCINLAPLARGKALLIQDNPNDMNNCSSIQDLDILSES